MRTILVDFDGVLHSYTSAWQGVEVVADPPVPGALEWLKEMLMDPEYTMCIYSSRSSSLIGVNAMKQWMYKNGMSPAEIGRLAFPMNKPAAFLTIDDRCFLFKGLFPSKEEINNFKAWNK